MKMRLKSIREHIDGAATVTLKGVLMGFGAGILAYLGGLLFGGFNSFSGMILELLGAMMIFGLPLSSDKHPKLIGFLGLFLWIYQSLRDKKWRWT